MTTNALWKVDLHTHTCYSKDSLTSLEAYVAACQRKGIQAAAVTDHNVIDGALALRELAPFSIIVGEEIKTAEGEIIGLFLEQWIPPDLTPEETVARIRDQGGLVYIPHPGDRLRGSVLRPQALDRIAPHVDIRVYRKNAPAPVPGCGNRPEACPESKRRDGPQSEFFDTLIIEVFNARVTLPGDNETARTLALERGLLHGAGSDAHTPCEIGRAHVVMEPFASREEFLDHLARGQVVGRLSNPLVHFASLWAKVRKRLLL